MGRRTGPERPAWRGRGLPGRTSRNGPPLYAIPRPAATSAAAVADNDDFAAPASRHFPGAGTVPGPVLIQWAEEQTRRELGTDAIHPGLLHRLGRGRDRRRGAGGRGE